MGMLGRRAAGAGCTRCAPVWRWQRQAGSSTLPCPTTCCWPTCGGSHTQAAFLSPNSGNQRGSPGAVSEPQ